MTIQGLSAGFDYCYPIMAPQTEIPLTGEMSRSDKRVTARYKQLEPVTLNMLSATAVASLYRNAKTIHRIVLSATDNSRVPLLRYGVAGERTVQRCRQKQKDRSMSDLFVWRLKQRFHWQGKCHWVTKGWLRGTSSSNLWLWICCRQLPLPHCIATPKQFTGLFWLRQITATFRYCNTVSQARELCRGADRNKKTAHRAIFFGASNSDSPDRGNVTEWQKGDCEVRAARTCGRCRCTEIT